MRRLRSFAFLVVGWLAVSASAGCSPGPATCDDVGRAVGGCESGQPTYAAETCEGLAEEFGQQLNDRLLSILAGPEPNDKSLATAAKEDRILTIVRMNQHMQSVNLVCDRDQMVSASSEQLTTEFKNQAPRFIDDGDSIYDFDHYLDELREDLVLIEWRND